MIVKVAPSRAGHLEGLLGDPGEPFDELVGGNGAVYSLDQLAAPWESVQDFDVLYHQFAQSWRITQQSSLFYYPPGTSTASFTDLAFPSRAVTVASLTPTTVAAAKRDCKAEGITNPYLLSDCVYDLGLAGGRNVCLGGAEARVQAATGGPTATGLPESSGAVLPLSAAPPSSGSPRPGHQHRHPGHGRERPERTAGRRSGRVGHGLRRVGAKLDQAELLQAG